MPLLGSAPLKKLSSGSRCSVHGDTGITPGKSSFENLLPCPSQSGMLSALNHAECLHANHDGRLVLMGSLFIPISLPLFLSICCAVCCSDESDRNRSILLYSRSVSPQPQWYPFFCVFFVFFKEYSNKSGQKWECWLKDEGCSSVRDSL